MDQVQCLIEQPEKAAGYVVVRNAAHSESFALFDSAEVRVRLKSDLGGKGIPMTRLQDWLVEALNRENVTISAAAKHAAFSLLDRQRKRFAEIESAADLLLPTK